MYTGHRNDDGQIYGKFYFSFCVDGSVDKWFDIAWDLAWFYKGGVSMAELENMPISKLLRIKASAERLDKRLRK